MTGRFSVSRRVLAAWLLLGSLVAPARAATDVRVDFMLQTRDVSGGPLSQHRNYFVYRPDNLPKSKPAPMVLVMENGPATFFHREADLSGFVVVSCTFAGNSGNGWKNGNPRDSGYEDYDYISAVIDRVAEAENCRDAFICGFSAGGHTAYAYACVHPEKLRAACSVEEFMGLTTNIPTAPLPIMAIHGTLDANVNYTMARDTVDAWRAVDGLMEAKPAVTYEPSPLQPRAVTQATWRGGRNGTQVAFVTVVGGTHRWTLPGAQTGYDCTAGMWAFFRQFLSIPPETNRLPPSPMLSAVPTGSAFRISPAEQTVTAGQPATYSITGGKPASEKYQWRMNGIDLVGQTSNSLTLPRALNSDSGSVISVLITNSTGTVDAVATLTVLPAAGAPVLVSSPARARVTTGQTAAFAVIARSPTPMTYQWQKGTGMTHMVDIPGATAATFTTPPTTLIDHATLIRCVISNTAGSTVSASEILFVTAPPSL